MNHTALKGLQSGVAALFAVLLFAVLMSAEANDVLLYVILWTGACIERVVHFIVALVRGPVMLRPTLARAWQAALVLEIVFNLFLLLISCNFAGTGLVAEDARVDDGIIFTVGLLLCGEVLLLLLDVVALCMASTEAIVHDQGCLTLYSGERVDVLKLRRAQVSDRDEQCVICLEEFEAKHAPFALSCGHRYHRACSREWLSRSDLCPLCRAEVVQSA